MNAAVTVSIVTWNAARVIRACLASLEQQTFTDYQLIVIDNASADDTVAIVRRVAPRAALIPNQRNVGFGRGHNQAILLSSSRFVLCLNPDVVLEPSTLARLVHALEAAPDRAVAGPKLLRYEQTSDELNPVRRTGIVDSAGIIRTRGSRFVDRGANQPDSGSFDVSGDVFAVSGACGLFRRAALEDIRHRQEYFDEDFFLYKEDIDLCWRLRNRGWRIHYEPRAVALHRRGIGPPSQDWNPLQQRGQRRARPLRIRQLSYRNHLLTLWKNQTAGELLRTLPSTLVTEVGKICFLLLTEPRTLAGLPGALRLLPAILRKRRLILRQRHRVLRPLDHHPQLSE